MKTTNMKLFGNAYLDPAARATPVNQQEILEGFGADYQRLSAACAAGRRGAFSGIEASITCGSSASADATNQQFHDACEEWLAESNAKAAIGRNELLAEFGARTLAILSSDQDWSSETLAEIARAADALELSKYDDEGFFKCGIEGESADNEEVSK